MSKENKKVQRFVLKVKSIKNKKEKYNTVMQEFKKGTLRASAGYVVKNPAQARVISYYMAYGKRVPTSSRKKKSFFGKLREFIKGRFHAR